MKAQKNPRQTSCLTSGSCNHSVQSKSSHTLRTSIAIVQLAALLIFLLAVGSVKVFAQSASSGTVIGTVTDQSGAVVPDATVSITELSTSTTNKVTTNSAGHYAFGSVPPGTYNIKITKSGFQTALVQSQVVEVGKSLTEDVKLTVGSVTQEVTVETTGTELQTLNATVGNTVTGVALDSLPSLGRDVSTFVELQPGVSPDGSVAGTVVDQSTFLLDGGQNSNDMDGSMTVYTPSFAGDPTGGVANQNGGVAAGPTGVMPTPADSVEEFKVNTANQTADFNSSSGAQVEVVTKRGTNTIHGSLYEYYLDNNFNANTWDNNLTGTKVPDYHYSRFGVSLGGPVIPKEILGGKTYMFGNYQGFRWPNSSTIERAVPSANMRAGILTFSGTTYNLNTLDPRGIGLNPQVKALWSKFEPMPNDPSCGSLLGSRCDGVNEQGFKANIGIPQNDNFGVVRLDHDFSSKLHFNTSYRYYKLTRATTDQVDIGGFFPGDTLGTPAAVSNRPQVPWFFVAGLTANISSNVTNDFHYSYLRNWWQWGTQGGPAQLPGLGAALEPLGESQTASLVPFNVNAQQARTRFWDGQDNYFRDDVTMLHGNHLFQFGGIYQHNFNYHQRTDNGGGINYYPTYQLGDTSGAGVVDMSGLAIPQTTTAKRAAAAVLGIVTDSQTAYTRSGPNLALNPLLTPAFDQSTIPYYNVYFSDSWHIKPSLTLTYGLGWTLEMPPTERNGKQIEFVDSSDQPIDTQAYIASRQRAALQGQVFNPTVGFALLANTGNSPKYPYDPFYGSFSPRVAVAWNPHFSGDSWVSKIFGEDKTVIRGGYGRIYGRLNGVDLVLVPLLGTGLIQAVQCRQVYMPNAVPNTPNGACAPAGAPALTVSNVFRIGTDGNTAPLQAASPTLPQPDFPGINAAAAGAGEALDPHFRPNVVDSFDVTIQRQLSNRLTVEFGYIGRLINHEYQPININAVPYMMTMGGQQFQSAYAALETTLGCATSVAACGANVPAATIADPVIPKQKDANPAYAAYINALPQQAFFTASLNPAYCKGNFPGVGGTAFASCTAAVASNELGNFESQAVWSLWSDLDQGGGTNAGFNFACTMLNCPINTPLGGGGQLSSGVGINASIGHGNYHAGFVSVRMSEWRGLTMQQNFTYSKALGTGAFVQATSSYTANDPFNLDTMYGVQAFNRKFVYNTFLVYQPPFYKNQEGALGRVLGGWNFSPIFTAGSGEPVYCNTQTDAQAFGSGDGTNFFNNEQCQFTQGYNAGVSSHFGVLGGTDAAGNSVGTAVATTASGAAVGVNQFANPVSVWNTVRAPILGIDHRDGGVGPISGLPYWNLDLSVKKNIRIAERFSTEFQVIFTNVLNHNVFADPTLDISNPSGWGVINHQINTPRKMEFGLRVSW
jgi:hypothetical protein